MVPACVIDLRTQSSNWQCDQHKMAMENAPQKVVEPKRLAERHQTHQTLSFRWGLGTRLENVSTWIMLNFLHLIAQ